MVIEFSHFSENMIFHKNGAIFTKICGLGTILAISRRRLIWTTNYCSKLVLLRCPGAQKGDFHTFSPYSTILGPKSTFCRNELLFTFWCHFHPIPPKCAAPPSGRESNSSSAKRLVGMGPGWGPVGDRLGSPVKTSEVSRSVLRLL